MIHVKVVSCYPHYTMIRCLNCGWEGRMNDGNTDPEFLFWYRHLWVTRFEEVSCQSTR